MKTLWLLGVLLFLLGCTDEDAATRALTGSGFTDITFTGYKWFACGESDFSHTGFCAVGPTGVPVEGVVCRGLFLKACTVRF